MRCGAMIAISFVQFLELVEDYEVRSAAADMESRPEKTVEGMRQLVPQAHSCGKPVKLLLLFYCVF